jgi:hypothetical protein
LRFFSIDASAALLEPHDLSNPAQLASSAPMSTSLPLAGSHRPCHGGEFPTVGDAKSRTALRKLPDLRNVPLS